MARASKKKRKQAIDDLPDVPGGPLWRHLGPYGPAVPLIPLVAKELAKLMIDMERDRMSDDDAFRLFRDMGFDAPTEEQIATSKPKKKRKVSAYSKQFGKELKALKKKHPRTPIKNLMKRAHTATRKTQKTGRTSPGRARIRKSRQFDRDRYRI